MLKISQPRNKWGLSPSSSPPETRPGRPESSPPAACWTWCCSLGSRAVPPARKPRGSMRCGRRPLGSTSMLAKSIDKAKNSWKMEISKEDVILTGRWVQVTIVGRTKDGDLKGCGTLTGGRRWSLPNRAGWIKDAPERVEAPSSDCTFDTDTSHVVSKLIEEAKPGMFGN